MKTIKVKEEILKDWYSLFKEKLNIDNEYKLHWLAKCGYYDTQRNNTLIDDKDYVTQDGIAPSLLPLVCEIAKKTEALDLISIIPMKDDLMRFSYLDFVYNNNTIVTQTFEEIINLKSRDINVSIDETEINKTNIDKIEKTIINELVHLFTRKILDLLFNLGSLNNSLLKLKEDISFDFNIDTLIDDNKSSMYVIGNRIKEKIMGAYMKILSYTKIGKPNYIVTNLQPSPINNIETPSCNSLHRVGNVNSMNLYVDPDMKFKDNRILIGRREPDEDPGIKFFIYSLIDKLEKVEKESKSEFIIKSIYDIIKIGNKVEQNYYTMNINLGNTILI